MELYKHIKANVINNVQENVERGKKATESTFSTSSVYTLFSHCLHMYIS